MMMINKRQGKEYHASLEQLRLERNETAQTAKKTSQTGQPNVDQCRKHKRQGLTHATLLGGTLSGCIHATFRDLTK